jgi:hypothetical protein
MPERDELAALQLIEFHSVPASWAAFHAFDSVMIRQRVS